MGGGKGGPEPIYKPKYTPQLEALQTAQIFGTLAQQSPELAQILNQSDYGQRLKTDILGGPVGQPVGGYVASPRPTTGGYAAEQAWLKSEAQKKAASQMLQSSPQSSQVGSFNFESLAPKSQNIIAQSGPGLSYENLAQNIYGGQTMSGQSMPQYKDYTPYQYSGNNYSPYQFSTKDISNVPKQAYQGVLNQGLGDIQKQQQMFGAQAAGGAAASGLGRGSGLLSGNQNALARSALEQGAGLSANLGLQQAQAELQNQQFLAGLQQQMQQSQAQENKFLPQFQFQQQQAQAGENFKAAQQALQAQQVLQGLDLQKIGALSALNTAGQQQAMSPYSMLSSLYAQNLGVPMPQGGKGGDPLSALISAGGMLGGGALMAGTGGAAAPAVAPAMFGAGATGIGFQ